MDLIKSILRIKDKHNNVKKYYIENPTKEQKYVLDDNNKERVVAYGNFKERQSGRSMAVCLKAIKLSQENNKPILIFCSSYASSEKCFDTIERLLIQNNLATQEVRRHRGDFSFRFVNGSSIRISLSTYANMRGHAVSYVLVDDASLHKNEEMFGTIPYLTLNDEDGQVFYFLGGN